MRLNVDIVTVVTPGRTTPEYIINAAGLGFREVYADTGAVIVFDDEFGVMQMLRIHGLGVGRTMDVSVVLARQCPFGPCCDCGDLGFLPLDVEL
jgi:hypothetical protein